jgi:hypothetical protein
MSKSSETTEGSSKVGGKAGVGINRPTIYSEMSTSSRKRKASQSTLDMYPAKTTQPMARPEGSMASGHIFSPRSPSPNQSNSISATSMRLSHLLSRALYKKEGPRHPSQNSSVPCSIGTEQTSKICSTTTPGPHSPRRKDGTTGKRFPAAIQHTPKTGIPARYAKDLCPLPSDRRPHVLASERLQLWTPTNGRESTRVIPTNLTIADIQQISVVIGKAWEESTLAAYGSGLLNFHVFCDQKSIPEEERAPASPTLIGAFIASIAGTYSGSTIDNYVYGIRAWHILHGVTWHMDTAELEALLRAAEKATPQTARKKKRVPYTPDFILAIRGQLNLDKPRDAAIYSCLTTTFYTAGRLGEFTVPNLGAFEKDRHVKPSDIRIEHDRNGLRSTVFHIPKTKTSNQGEDVSWSRQSGDTDPQAALARHMALNNPPPNGHLFAYLHKNGRHRPLTKPEFIKTVAAAARRAGLNPRQGHGIRIGSTLEYLLRGTPFEVMKVKGRWASDAFLIYLTRHAQILAPYMQAVPEVHEKFVRITMPQLRR